MTREAVIIIRSDQDQNPGCAMTIEIHVAQPDAGEHSNVFQTAKWIRDVLIRRATSFTEVQVQRGPVQ